MSNQQNNQNYLFYSKNFCEHSKRCVQQLNKYGLLNSLILCDIDNQELDIPPFINSVPTLYLSLERKILSENDLFAWINSYAEQNTHNSNNNIDNNIANTSENNNVLSFQQNELGGSNSIGYSFIDDKANDIITSSFEAIDGSNLKQVVVPSFTKINGVSYDKSTFADNAPPKSEKDIRQDKMNEAYNKLMQDRAMETKQNPINNRI